MAHMHARMHWHGHGQGTRWRGKGMARARAVRKSTARETSSLGGGTPSAEPRGDRLTVGPRCGVSGSGLLLSGWHHTACSAETTCAGREAHCINTARTTDSVAKHAAVARNGQVATPRLQTHWHDLCVGSQGDRLTGRPNMVVPACALACERLRGVPRGRVHKARGSRTGLGGGCGTQGRGEGPKKRSCCGRLCGNSHEKPDDHSTSMSFIGARSRSVQCNNGLCSRWRQSPEGLTGTHKQQHNNMLM